MSHDISYWVDSVVNHLKTYIEDKRYLLKMIILDRNKSSKNYLLIIVLIKNVKG